jgi:hypothetical protein
MPGDLLVRAQNTMCVLVNDSDRLQYCITNSIRETRRAHHAFQTD